MNYKAILLTALVFSTNVTLAQDEGPVTTVPELKLDRYLGKWYQIAAIPAWFQRNCAKNTTAEYSKSAAGIISVLNSCEKENGEISNAKGAARLNAKFNSPSKLQVTFVNIFGNWIWAFNGDYWVMDLGANYEYSVVGDPSRKYLWILARKPQMALDELKTIRAKIMAQNYDASNIIVTQPGDWNGKKLSVLDAVPTGTGL